MRSQASPQVYFLEPPSSEASALRRTESIYAELLGVAMALEGRSLTIAHRLQPDQGQASA
ncbi:MAG TPA: hypothetical protein V6D06_03975 [Trichocoleus sp.]